MAESELIVNFIGKDKLSSVASGIGGAFDKTGGAIKAGLAIGVTALAGFGAAVVGTGAKLISLGSDAQEMLGKFNVVFAETGGQVTDQLTTFADAVGRSKFELLGMASTFGDTLKPMGFTEEQAADLSVQMTELATDLGSFNNMPMDEALQRLQGTLIGSHENALAFGVVINENTLKAELARNGWDKLTGTQLEQAKVQARINLLMAGTTDAQGDALRTSTSWANQIRGLKATITDWATEMGLKLLPVFTPLLEKLGALAGEWLPKLGDILSGTIIPFLQTTIGAIESFFSNLSEGMDPLNAFIEAIWDIAPQPLLDSLVNFRDNILPGLEEKFQLLKDKITEFVAPIGEWIAGFFEWKDVLIGLGIVVGVVLVSAIGSLIVAMAPIILTIGAVIAAVALARQVWENDFLGIRTALEDFWFNTGEPIFNTVKEWLATNIPIAIDFLKNAWENVLLPAITAVWDWMSNTLIPFITDTLVPWLQEHIPAAIETLRSFWEDTLLPALNAVWQFLSEDMMPIWVALGEFFDATFTVSLTALQGIWENVLLPAMTKVYNYVNDNIGPAFEWLKTHIIDPVKGSFDGLASTIQSVADWISNLATSIGNVQLPDWMTPGSPTPWEIGLMGVRTQLQGLARAEIPALSASLQGLQRISNDNSSRVTNNTWNVRTERVNLPGLTQTGLQFANGGI